MADCLAQRFLVICPIVIKPKLKFERKDFPRLLVVAVSTVAIHGGRGALLLVAVGLATHGKEWSAIVFMEKYTVLQIAWKKTLT